jgi:hypothetical protein
MESIASIPLAKGKQHKLGASLFYFNGNISGILVTGSVNHAHFTGSSWLLQVSSCQLIHGYR